MHFLLYPVFANLLTWSALGEWLQKAAINVGSLLFVLGVLVFVHEFGHYAVAKLFGVRVEVFSLGFGKRLWGFRRGDTDYRISVLPLGGYVKMSGENPMEDRTGDPGEFTSHPRWQRFLIAVAGPAMNIVLAIAVLTAVYMTHDEEPAFLSQPVVIGSIEPKSPADKAGIAAGDRIARIQNISNPTWQQAFLEIMISPKQPVDITVDRAGQTFQATIVPQPAGAEQVGDAGWSPQQAAMVGKITKGLPADKAGIKPGDEIIAFNDTPVKDMHQFVSMLQEAKATPVQLTVLRKNAEMKLTVTPELTDDESGSGDKKYRIGFNPAQKMTVQRLPFRAAFAQSLDTCKSNSMLLFRLIPRLIQQKNSIRQMSGPVGIAQLSGAEARQGFAPLMKFLSLLSVSLAVLNLLPIPILDGGLMLMLLIEGMMRRDIKLEIKERVYQVAFVFLVLFFVVVTYYDIAKSFHS
jgi:regulator of sigma E protease